jgi:hypothetical protein
MLNDAFLSIVQHEKGTDNLLVRARRPGDIEKVFGRRTIVSRTTDADYLYRATITREDVRRAVENEVNRICYPNFKSSVENKELHDAYMGVWTTMSKLQDPEPYSGFLRHFDDAIYTGGSKPDRSNQYPKMSKKKRLHRLRKVTKANAKLPDSLLDDSLDDTVIQHN